MWEFNAQARLLEGAIRLRLVIRLSRVRPANVLALSTGLTSVRHARAALLKRKPPIQKPRPHRLVAQVLRPAPNLKALAPAPVPVKPPATVRHALQRRQQQRPARMEIRKPLQPPRRSPKMIFVRKVLNRRCVFQALLVVPVLAGLPLKVMQFRVRLQRKFISKTA